MAEFDITKILLSVGGLAGVAGIIEVVANSVQILDWIKSKIHRTCDGNENDDNSNQISIEIPNNLPSSGKLIGRKVLVKKLCSAVDKNALTMVIGRGGIGKSSLALEAVKRYYLSKSKKHFRFDAIVWISAKNEEISFPNFLDTVARVMEYTGVLQIADIDSKEIEVKQLFQKNRILLIVDNFETIADERIVSFIEAVCDNDRVIITTRENKIWNISYSSIYVEKLDDKEGISLIKHEYDNQSLDFNKVSTNSLSKLLRATDGSPLAIKWAVGQIATTRLPIERIIASLQTGRGDVFEKMFSSSWRSLDEVSQSILYMLLFFSPVASRDALFHASGLDEFSFDISISKLSRLSLIEVNGENITNQIYGFHPLTRSFVEKMKDDANIYDASFYQPLLAYYIEFCKENGEIGTPVAYDRLEKEQNNIIKLIHWATNCQVYNDSVISLITHVSVFLWNRGYWTKRIELSELACEIAQQCENIKQAIIHQYYVGIVRFWQGDLDNATRAVLNCKRLLDNADDAICEALILRLEALIHMVDNSDISVSNFMSVLQTLETADAVDVRLFADWRVNSRLGYKAGVVAIYQELGITFNRNKQYQKAITWLDKSLELAKKISDYEGQAVSLSHLGFSHLGLNDYAKAEKLCSEGLKLALSVNRKSTIGRCYQVLAESEAMRRHKRKAIKYAESAFEIFERLGMAHELDEVKRYLK